MYSNMNGIYLFWNYKVPYGKQYAKNGVLCSNCICQNEALKGTMSWWLVYNHVPGSRLRSLYSRPGSMVSQHWVFDNLMHYVFSIFRMDKCAECLLPFIQTSWICRQETLLCKCCCRTHFFNHFLRLSERYFRDWFSAVHHRLTCNMVHLGYIMYLSYWIYAKSLVLVPAGSTFLHAYMCYI